jgi:hypothetical protein
MKKLLKKSFLYLLPIFLVFIVFELFYRLVPNNYTLKAINIPKNYDKAEVLIFGNSHTFYGLNPEHFDKPTFNISNVSQTLYFDNLLFENYIDKFKKVKSIIMNVDYFTLSEIDNCEEDNWRKYYYEYYYNLKIPTISKYNHQRFFLSSTRDFNSNLKLVWRYIQNGTLVDCDSFGFGINYKFENKVKLTPKDYIHRAISHENNLVDFTKNSNRLQRIINNCTTKNIKVILVTMPVTSGYSSRVNQVKLNKIISVCKKLEEKNNNVFYINLFNDNRIKDEDFFDADHLHDKGAIKCSLLINEFLNLNNKKLILK